MSIRARLILSFVIVTAISLVTTAAEYAAFHQSAGDYHRLTQTLIPNYDAVGEMIDLTRELGDQPLAYAFAQNADEKTEILTDFRQSVDELTKMVDDYQRSAAGYADPSLPSTAQELVNRGETFFRLFDQQASNSELQAAKQSTEMAEDHFQDLLADSVAAVENDMTGNVISESEDAIAGWTTISALASVIAAGVALYVLIRFITRPVQQLKIGAAGMAAGDYSRRVTVERKDEIGELAVAFNSMADAVEKRQLELTGLNQTLETRVDERTEQMRQAKEQAEAILNNTSDAIILIGGNNVIDRANAAFLNLFDYADADVPRLPMERLVHEAEYETLRDALSRAANGDGRGRLELSCRRRDGTNFSADVAFGKVGGEPYSRYVLCSFHDITPQKLAQRELEEALRKERELGAMKSGFVSLVSHEFRTPLAVIQSSTDLMRRYWDRLDAERRSEKLESIQAQIDLMVSYLEDFLTVNGTEMVDAKFVPVEIDIFQFTRDLIDELQTALSTHAIALSAQGGTGAVFADRKLLRQILVNLLTNAVKYSTPGDSIDVEIIGAPENVVVRVRDHGIGIPKEDQAHLFDPFHRGTNVENIKGTGLGLAIVKRAVEAHRGTISFQSEVGQGTTFTVVFPMSSPAENA